jgi:hypothetical protein
MNTRNAIVVSVSLVFLVVSIALVLLSSTNVVPEESAEESVEVSMPEITYVEVTPVSDGLENTVEVSWGAIPYQEGLLTWALVYSENNDDPFMDSKIYTLSCTQECDGEERFSSLIELQPEGVLNARIYIETREGTILTQSEPVAIE